MIPADAEQGQGQLARELNSLLDGSLRSLGLARNAMWQMAALLHPARPIGEAVRWLAELTHQGGDDIEIDVRIEQAAAKVPIGPLGPVLFHFLRTAVRASQVPDSAGVRVDLAVSVNQRRELEIVISARRARFDDDGLGLGLSRQVIDELGGRFGLSEGPSGRGLQLRAEIPVGRLTGS